jgi:hypothetical protein
MTAPNTRVPLPANMDSLLQPPRASYFQSTFTKPTIMDGTVYQLSRVRKPAPKGATDARASPPPTPLKATAASFTIEVIVGTQGTHTYTRTWHLSRALLAKHSSTVRNLPEDEKSIVLASTPPQIFQNYLDYARSSIYSLNRLIPVSPLRQHTSAWLLGSTLGSPDFCVAALRALHGIFEPCARSRHSTAARSPIKAEDVEYVCRESVVGSALRVMYFDAVAAHWTRFEAENVEREVDEDVDMDRSALEDEGGGRDGEEQAKNITWADICAKYADFRTRILLSLMFSDGRRDLLLRSAEEYVLRKKVEQKPSRGRKRAGQFRSPVRVAVRRSTEEGRARRNTEERERRPKAGLRPSPVLEERVMVMVSGEEGDGLERDRKTT